MTEEQKLIEKLRRIEALFAGTTFKGERDAAANAMDRIRNRLRDVEQSDPPIEYRFGMLDTWSRKLLVALLRRYGIKSYRYYGQRRTTVMAKVSSSFVDQTLWPEFLQLNTTLCAYLAEVTNRVISDGICSGSCEVEVRNQSGEAAHQLPREIDSCSPGTS